MIQSKKSKFSAFVAGFTAFCLAFTQVAFATPAFSTSNPEVSLPDAIHLDQAIALSVPSSIATIDKLQSGSGKTIFHIQTAHGQYQADKQIESLLHYLEKNYGVETLLMEGASNPLNPEIINFFPEDRKSTLEAVDAFVRHSVISGPEVFLLNSGKARGFGIEEEKTYDQNLQDFAGVIKARNESGQFLSNLDMGIERLAAVHLSSDLRSFLKQVERKETSNVPFDAYLQQLQIAAQKNAQVDLSDASWQLLWPMLVRVFTIEKLEKKIDAASFEKQKKEFISAIKPYLGQGTKNKEQSLYGEVEKLLNLKDLSSKLPDPETSALFEKLVQSLPANFNYDRFSSVTAFCGILMLKSQLQVETLADEISRLEDKIADKLAETKNAKALIAVLKDYRMLKKLFALELLPADFDAIFGAPIKPTQIVEKLAQLNGKTRAKAGEFKNSAELDSLYNKAVRFYQGARLRDQKMLSRIEERLAETGADKVAVVTGGFHSAPFAQYFKERGYNYALMTPKLTTVDVQGRQNYLDVMQMWAAMPKVSDTKVSDTHGSVGSATIEKPQVTSFSKSLANRFFSGFVTTVSSPGVFSRLLPRLATGAVIVGGVITPNSTAASQVSQTMASQVKPLLDSGEPIVAANARGLGQQFLWDWAIAAVVLGVVIYVVPAVYNYFRNRFLNKKIDRLKMVGGIDAISVLRKLVSHKSPGVSTNAWVALVRLNDFDFALNYIQSEEKLLVIAKTLSSKKELVDDILLAGNKLFIPLLEQVVRIMPREVIETIDDTWEQSGGPGDTGRVYTVTGMRSYPIPNPEREALVKGIEMLRARSEARDFKNYTYPEFGTGAIQQGIRSALTAEYHSIQFKLNGVAVGGMIERISSGNFANQISLIAGRTIKIWEEVSETKNDFSGTVYVAVEVTKVGNAITVSVFTQRSEVRQPTMSELKAAAAYRNGELTGSVLSRPARESREDDVKRLSEIQGDERKRLVRLAVDFLRQGKMVFSVLAAGASSRMNTKDAPKDVEAMVGEREILSKAAVPVGQVGSNVVTYLDLFGLDVGGLLSEVDVVAQTAGLTSDANQNSLLILSNAAYQGEHEALIAADGNYGLQDGQVRFFQQPLGAIYKATPKDVEAYLKKNPGKHSAEDEAAFIAAAAEADEKFKAGDGEAAIAIGDDQPLGHGEFLHQLVASGELLNAVKTGKKVFSVRNVDNAGAKFDEEFLVSLGLFLDGDGKDFQGEVSMRTKGQKGGSLFVMSDNGQKQLVEDPTIAATNKAKASEPGYQTLDSTNSYWFNDAVALISTRYVMDIYKKEGQTDEAFVSEMETATADQVLEIAARGRAKFSTLLDVKPSKMGKYLTVKVETNMWQSTGVVSSAMNVDAVGVYGARNLPIDEFPGMTSDQIEDWLGKLRFLSAKQWNVSEADFQKAKTDLQEKLGHPVSDEYVRITLETYEGNKPVVKPLLEYILKRKRIDPNVLANRSEARFNGNDIEAAKEGIDLLVALQQTAQPQISIKDLTRKISDARRSPAVKTPLRAESIKNGIELLLQTGVIYVSQVLNDGTVFVSVSDSAIVGVGKSARSLFQTRDSALIETQLKSRLTALALNVKPIRGLRELATSVMGGGQDAYEQWTRTSFSIPREIRGNGKIIFSQGSANGPLNISVENVAAADPSNTAENILRNLPQGFVGQRNGAVVSVRLRSEARAPITPEDMHAVLQRLGLSQTADKDQYLLSLANQDGYIVHLKDAAPETSVVIDGLKRDAAFLSLFPGVEIEDLGNRQISIAFKVVVPGGDGAGVTLPKGWGIYPPQNVIPSLDQPQIKLPRNLQEKRPGTRDLLNVFDLSMIQKLRTPVISLPDDPAIDAAWINTPAGALLHYLQAYLPIEKRQPLLDRIQVLVVEQEKLKPQVKFAPKISVVVNPQNKVTGLIFNQVDGSLRPLAAFGDDGLPRFFFSAETQGRELSPTVVDLRSIAVSFQVQPSDSELVIQPEQRSEQRTVIEPIRFKDAPLVSGSQLPKSVKSAEGYKFFSVSLAKDNGLLLQDLLRAVSAGIDDDLKTPSSDSVAAQLERSKAALELFAISIAKVRGEASVVIVFDPEDRLVALVPQAREFGNDDGVPVIFNHPDAAASKAILPQTGKYENLPVQTRLFSSAEKASLVIEGRSEARQFVKADLATYNNGDSLSSVLEGLVVRFNASAIGQNLQEEASFKVSVKTKGDNAFDFVVPSQSQLNAAALLQAFFVASKNPVNGIPSVNRVEEMKFDDWLKSIEIDLLAPTKPVAKSVPRSESRLSPATVAEIKVVLTQFTAGILSLELNRQALSAEDFDADQIRQIAREVLGVELRTDQFLDKDTLLDELLSLSTSAGLHVNSHAIQIGKEEAGVVAEKGLSIRTAPEVLETIAKAPQALAENVLGLADGEFLDIVVADGGKSDLLRVIESALASNNGIADAGLRETIFKTKIRVHEKSQLATFVKEQQAAKGNVAVALIMAGYEDVLFDGINDLENIYRFKLGNSKKPLVGKNLWAVPVVHIATSRVMANIAGVESSIAGPKLLNLFDQLGLKVTPNEDGSYGFGAIDTLLQAIVTAKYIEIMA